MQVLLFGGSGVLGQGIGASLVSAGHDVTGLVRSDDAAEKISSICGKAIVVDFSSPTAIAEAAAGADAAVVQIPASMPDRASVGFAEAIAAGLQGGTRRVLLLTNVVTPQHPVGVSRADARSRIAAAFRDRLPGTTVVSATQFLENFSQGLRAAIEYGGVLPYPVPDDAPVAWLALKDYAALIERILVSPQTAGQQIALGGLELLTGADIAAAISESLGRPVTFQYLPPDAFASQLAPFLGAEVAGEIAALVAWSTGAGAPIAAPDVSALMASLNYQPMSVRDWAKSAFG